MITRVLWILNRFSFSTETKISSHFLELWRLRTQGLITALHKPALCLPPIGTCWTSCAQFIRKLQNTGYSQVRGRYSRPRQPKEWIWASLYLTRSEKNKAGKQSGFREIPTHLTAGRKPSPQRPREERCVGWILPGRVPRRTCRERICIDIQCRACRTSASYQSYGEAELLCHTNCGGFAGDWRIRGERGPHTEGSMTRLPQPRPVSEQLP